MKVKVIFYLDESGGYTAQVPGFPGCVSEGETLDEARANIREAFEGVFESMQEAPDPGEVEPGGRVEVLQL